MTILPLPAPPYTCLLYTSQKTVCAFAGRLFRWGETCCSKRRIPLSEWRYARTCGPVSYTHLLPPVVLPLRGARRKCSHVPCTYGCALFWRSVSFLFFLPAFTGFSFVLMLIAGSLVMVRKVTVYVCLATMRCMA